MKRFTDKTDRDSILRLFEERRADMAAVRERCEEIVETVRIAGDDALRKLTLELDRVSLDDGIAVPRAMMAQALKILSPELHAAIDLAIARIRRFHAAGRPESFELKEDGGRVGTEWRPLRRAGIYAPGGTAPLFSTLLMCAVPAQVAGCEEIVVCTPPQEKLCGGIHPALLASCEILGLSQLYRVGGAQAVAAMAYGTDTIPRVDVIVGPGNSYVTEAKRLVQGDVRIDSLAGPSEVLVIADKSANPVFVAADLLSQAEHAGDNGCVVISDDLELLDQVVLEVELQQTKLSRESMAQQSIEKYGMAILVENMDDAFELSDLFAPEHLELMMENARRWLPKVRAAGAIFLGAWTPEPIGDYIAGPNHVLPTGGSARFAGPLSTEDFMKRTSVLEFDRKGLMNLAEPAMRMAMEEGLDAHAASIRVRMEAES